MSDQQSQYLYDLGYLEELSGGNQEFVDGLLETFLKNIPEQMEQMISAYRANDLKTMGESAHKMKPSLDLFRIHSLHDAIRFVEIKGKEGINDPQLGRTLDEVQETMRQVMQSMSKN